MQMRTTRKSFSPLLEVDYLASRARQRTVLRPAAAAQGQKHPILPLATGFSSRQGQNSPSAPLANSGGLENMLDVCRNGVSNDSWNCPLCHTL